MAEHRIVIKVWVEKIDEGADRMKPGELVGDKHQYARDVTEYDADQGMIGVRHQQIFDSVECLTLAPVVDAIHQSARTQEGE